MVSQIHGKGKYGTQTGATGPVGRNCEIKKHIYLGCQLHDLIPPVNQTILGKGLGKRQIRPSEVGVDIIKKIAVK
jgi:hypothetical protein